MTRILVTGAAGFIGSNLVKRLVADGFHVIAHVRSADRIARLAAFGDKISLLPADITDWKSVSAMMSETRPNLVVHSAMPVAHPQSASQRLQSLESAVMGTAHVAEAALECGVERFIYMDSSLAYGRPRRPIREEDPVEPGTFKGAAKAAARLWLQQFVAATGFPSISLRLFSVYGPHELESRFIPTVLRAALTGKILPLRRGPRHDFVFVADVVEACLLAMVSDLAPGTAFNIGSGTSWANEEVVEAARLVTGASICVDESAYPPSPADTLYWQADITAATNQLGWRPRHLHDGLRAYYEWMKSA